MKSIIILVFVVVAVNALSEEFIEQFMEKMQAIAEVCVEETGANDEDIAELIARQLPPTTHEAKCMIFCFNKKFGIQHEDGALDKVGAIIALEPLRNEDFELYKQILGVGVKCGEKDKELIADDPCMTATNVAVCMHEEANKAGIDSSFFA